MDLKRFDPAQWQGPLPSPCVSVCRMDASSGLCDGCQRTIEEIAAWGGASEAEKRTIWQAVCARRAAIAERERT